jgi:hypothetical protein
MSEKLQPDGWAYPMPDDGLRSKEPYVWLSRAEAALAAERQRADKLESELAFGREPITDEQGTVWVQPTTWAYMQACKAIESTRAQYNELRALLQSARPDDTQLTTHADVMADLRDLIESRQEERDNWRKAEQTIENQRRDNRQHQDLYRGTAELLRLANIQLADARRERDEAHVLLASAKAEAERLRAALEHVKRYTKHREDSSPYETCYDWCPRCRIDTALAPPPAALTEAADLICALCNYPESKHGEYYTGSPVCQLFHDPSKHNPNGTPIEAAAEQEFTFEDKYVTNWPKEARNDG